MKKTSPSTQPLGAYLDEREQRINDDYEWCLRDSTVRAKYGGKVVVAYLRKIWGAGKNFAAAWAAAQRKRGCPAKHDVAVVNVPSDVVDAQAK